MNSLENIFAQIQELIETEKNLDRQLDEYEDIAVQIEREQAPELARITLLHSNIVRGKLDKSRRFWMKLATILGIAFVGTLLLILIVLTTK